MDRTSQAPGFDGLTVGFAANQDGGRASLGSERLGLDLHPLFDRPLCLDRLSGLLEWGRDADGTLRLTGRNLTLENRDLGGRARFEVEIPADGDPPLLDLRAKLLPQSRRPARAEDWATLARDLSVKVVQISERDTQVARRPKQPGEFVNTWSIDGFVDELMQPAELSLGTAEPRRPTGSHWHRRGSGTIYLRRPGGATYARSWLPSLGG